VPEAQLREKFEGCATRVLPADRVARLYATILALEKLGDVREVTAMLANAAHQVPPMSQRRAAAE